MPGASTPEAAGAMGGLPPEGDAGSANLPDEPAATEGDAGPMVPEPGPDAGDVPMQTECDATKAPAIGAIGLEVVISGTELVGISYATQPPGSDDWYIVEQRGRIMVFADGQLRAAPFLDLSDEFEVDPMYDERGLHAIEFAPDYATSGLFYVVMTASAGERANRDMLLEFSRSESDPYVAEPTATRELLNLEGISPNSLFANIHNAYQARFGPDGMLYVGMGDGGGSCNDNAGFENTPQDVGNPYGKILRLDVSAPEPYGAADNPFVDGGDGRVLHYGVRNPFRFNWDAVTGDLYIGDVGQDTHEEINVAPAGEVGLNFGWPTWEGDEQVCANRPQAEGSEVQAPIFFTQHGTGSNQFGAGCSASPFCDFGAIVGGAVYRGAAIPSLWGAYLFGDWVSDNMAAIYHCEGQTSDVTVIDYEADPNLPNDGFFVKVGDAVPDLVSITSIVQDHDHELYITANGNSLLKLVPAP